MMKIQLGVHARKPVVGRGGLQQLLRELLPRADADGVVVLHDETFPGERTLASRVRRYREQYGTGGFQGELYTWLPWQFGPDLLRKLGT